MSEKKSHRPVSEIQQEFVNLASRAGQLQYQIATFQSDLAELNKVLRDLNLEGAASKAAEEKLAQEAAAPASGAV